MKHVVLLLCMLCAGCTVNYYTTVLGGPSEGAKTVDPGDLQRTDRELDLAIDGEGYFKILLPDQREAFTRYGEFHLDGEGNIVTAQGYPLVPNLRVPEEITQVYVDVTGLVQGLNPSQPSTLQQLGQIELTRFSNPEGLQPIRYRLFLESPSSGNRTEGFAGTTPGFGIIRQGFLEKYHDASVSTCPTCGTRRLSDK